MRRSHSLELVPYDPKIEKTLRAIRVAKKFETHAMAKQKNQQRTIRDYFKPVINDNYSGIARQTINVNNFELKPAWISMVQQNQFGVSPLEDPNVHLAMFLEICDIVKMNGVSKDSIWLRLFPFSLRDKARGWLQAMQPGSITSWEEMA